MNVLLKAIIKEVFDIEQLVVDAVHKAGVQVLMGDAMKAILDGNDIVANYEDIQAELQALIDNPASDEDLLALVVEMADGIDNQKAQGIIKAACQLALDVGVDLYNLISAVKE